MRMMSCYLRYQPRGLTGTMDGRQGCTFDSTLMPEKRIVRNNRNVFQRRSGRGLLPPSGSAGVRVIVGPLVAFVYDALATGAL